jgi:DNA-binding NarL/FixJ family response regulator
MFRKGLVEVLREVDVVVEGEASTAAEALAQLAAAPPDVAIIDLSLGRDSGLELVSTVAARYPAVRILVLSGYDERLYADRALKAGALGYLMKDKAAGDLLTAVRRIAAGKPYVSEDTADRILTSLGQPVPEGDDSLFDRLSDRGREVLRLMGQGLTTREIATRIGVAVKTVESHYEHIKPKLGVRNVRELMRVAVSWSER